MATKERRVNRNSADDARAVIETILPNESERRAVLSLLADLIERANRASVKAWNLTLFSNGIRLNVGQIEVFTLFDFRPVTANFRIDDGLLSAVGREEFRLVGAEIRGPNIYKTAPQVLIAEVPLVGVQRVSGILLSPAFKVVDAAAARRPGRLFWWRSHSPGAIRYLGEFLGRDLPQPSYDVPLEPAASVQIEEVPILDEIPIEDQNVASAAVAGATEPHDAEFRERALVIRYANYLRERGIRAVRYRIELAGGAGDLFCDLWDARRRNLIEAKGEITRDSIRMAIGQLADYGRFLEPDRSAVLLPERPSRDLEDLLTHVEIGMVWETSDGRFEDNSGGRFT
jgi:hypothetical protein